MPFRDIQQIEMFNSKEKIASQLDPAMVSRGLLTITTKDGKTPEVILNKHNNLSLTGFYPSRQFPDLNVTPDFRPTVYWNPDITTDATGTTTLQFNTSDAIGPYHIHVVAVDKRGKIGQGVATYRVVFE